LTAFGMENLTQRAPVLIQKKLLEIEKSCQAARPSRDEAYSQHS